MINLIEVKILVLIIQVGIAVSRTLFGDVDYNGTIFVNSEQDDDWVSHFTICFQSNRILPKSWE